LTITGLNSSKRSQIALIYLIITLLLTQTCSFVWALTDFDSGLQAASVGNLEGAIKYWSKEIDRNPKLYAAYINRGNAYMKRGFILRGISDWRKAHDLSPVFAYGFVSGDYIVRKSGSGPLVGFVVPLELDPDHVAAVIMMGSTYQDVGRADKASELYRNSVELTKNPLLKSRFEFWISTLNTE
jgi:tetratricopeptide (TPR) repeat protein